MLIHGGTATSQSWASHLPAFAEHFRVFAPDSRGHGRTDNPSGDLGYRAMADDVAASIDALGLRRPLVLGYSDGGVRIAWLRTTGLPEAIRDTGDAVSDLGTGYGEARRARRSSPGCASRPC